MRPYRSVALSVGTGEGALRLAAVRLVASRCCAVCPRAVWARHWTGRLVVVVLGHGARLLVRFDGLPALLRQDAVCPFWRHAGDVLVGIAAYPEAPFDLSGEHERHGGALFVRSPLRNRSTVRKPVVIGFLAFFNRSLV